MDLGLDTSVKVAVRIRPLLDHELSQNCANVVGVVPGEPQVSVGGDQCFTFDYVFGVESPQSEVYEESVINLVDATFDGFNATILAYGQTGSGKTFTMGSASSLRLNEDQQGIIPRVIQSVFESVRQRETKNPNCSYRVRIQFLEIYGEEIRDLLDPTACAKVTIRENPTGDVYISGAREELVTSAEEMMMVLERGTLSRTTGSTLMNQTSSRSHAIFTILLEKTIYPNIAEDEIQPNQSIDIDEPRSATTENRIAIDLNALGTTEVQKCKFHFVDLAGSERAKRTGAEGLRLREGIDINKGLLVLGNVISALGDEKKRGKTHVPYRDSKLTRMLQDSLGGNSKTLMICCVSPADTNLNESLNALRYANRARNIQNKPVVNRDPTVIIISELKRQVQVLASELLSIRRSITASNTIIQPPLPYETPTDVLVTLASSFDSEGGGGGDHIGLSISSRLGSPSRPTTNTSGQTKPTSTSTTTLSTSTSNQATTTAMKTELASLRSKQSDSDTEILRLTDQLKRCRMQLGQATEQSVLDRSERDFYKMKWTEADPEAARVLDRVEKANTGFTADTDSAELKEKTAFIEYVSTYIREIEELKKALSESRRSEMINGTFKNSRVTGFSDNPESGGRSSGGGTEGIENMFEIELDGMDSLLEGELTTSVARVIARTQEQLKAEEKRLRQMAEEAGTAPPPSSDDDKGVEDEDLVGDAQEVEVVDRAFQRRQKLMTAEVVDLNESIQLKEQLIHQLQSSQRQYDAMKAFYESKLQTLTSEMDEKEEEMFKLQAEIQELASRAKTEPAAPPGAEASLRERLQQKEEELKAMKSRQQELSHLSKVQSRHSDQMVKLQQEIENMKRQKVSLSRNMQTEKKQHLLTLTQKAREIEKLKRDLAKSASELQKLGKDKERAEGRAREALREGAVLKKRANDLLNNRMSHTEPALSLAKATKKVLKSAPKPGGNRMLSEDEMKLKRWIEQRVSEIATKEEAVDNLRRQCSEQLALLRQKDLLSKDIQNFKVQYHIGGDDGLSQDQDQDQELNSQQLSAQQEDELADMEERLQAMESQLAMRGSRIADMQRQYGNVTENSSPSDVTDATGIEKTVEALFNNTSGSGGSSPSFHDLIRLLLNQLVASKRRCEQRRDALEKAAAREKSKDEALEDMRETLVSAQRMHDKDLTKAVRDYEEKLQGLFEHSNMVQLMNSTSKVESTTESFSNIHSASAPSGLSTPLRYASSSFSSPSPNVMEDSRTTRRSTTMTGIEDVEAGAEQFKMMLALSTERNSALKAQLSREVSKTQDLQERLIEARESTRTVRRELAECQHTISFLEEECRALRGMAEEFKSRLKASGGEIGQAIIRQVREADMLMRGDAAMLDDDDDDDDSQSVLGEFTSLAEEIQRTGGVAATGQSGHSLPVSENKPQTKTGKNIFDRLTNPSNFTGTQKNLFQQDLQSKRAKVLQIKKEEAEASTRRRRELQISSQNSYNSLPLSSSTSSSSSSMSVNTVSALEEMNQAMGSQHTDLSSLSLPLPPGSSHSNRSSAEFHDSILGAASGNNDSPTGQTLSHSHSQSEVFSRFLKTNKAVSNTTTSTSSSSSGHRRKMSAAETMITNNNSTSSSSSNSNSHLGRLSLPVVSKDDTSTTLISSSSSTAYPPPTSLATLNSTSLLATPAPAAAPLLLQTVASQRTYLSDSNVITGVAEFGARKSITLSTTTEPEINRSSSRGSAGSSSNNIDNIEFSSTQRNSLRGKGSKSIITTTTSISLGGQKSGNSSRRGSRTGSMENSNGGFSLDSPDEIVSGVSLGVGRGSLLGGSVDPLDPDMIAPTTTTTATVDNSGKEALSPGIASNDTLSINVNNDIATEEVVTTQRRVSVPPAGRSSAGGTVRKPSPLAVPLVRQLDSAEQALLAVAAATTAIAISTSTKLDSDLVVTAAADSAVTAPPESEPSSLLKTGTISRDRSSRKLPPPMPPPDYF